MKRQWLAAMVAVIAGMAMVACSAGAGAVRVPEYLELKSRSLTLRQDLTRGGAIGYIAKAGEVRNFVNIADEGRYIQQSYYGGRCVDRRSEGQAETWSPWAWNPIQVGDCPQQSPDYDLPQTSSFDICGLYPHAVGHGRAPGRGSDGTMDGAEGQHRTCSQPADLSPHGHHLWR